ncbi:MAG TPA: zinc-ribbon domain-containing protein [Verrucomicrobiae bacterium]|nr:zinc-ribbon domain-containing protein [Verrucomicrobiae bacterium]
MPHCTKCGALVADNAGFCANCGAAQEAVPSAAASVAATTQTGLQENVAALLSYVFGWVTGLIFVLIDKRPSVQFHARQSIVIFGGLTVIHLLLLPVFGLSLLGGWGIFALLTWLIDIVGLVLWILCMVKAYQGVRFRVPIAAELSEKIFGRV